jgi:hypothetical protein
MPATEDQATEDQATEDQATENQATEDQATEDMVELRRRVLAEPAIWRRLSSITERGAFVEALAEQARQWHLLVDEAAIVQALDDARRQSWQRWV